MKTEYAEQNTKMAYDKEKILAIEKENKIKIDQVNDLLNKTAEMQEKFDSLQYKHQTALKQVSEQKLTIDVHLSQIQTLKNEKTHLRQSEVEARMLKETFEKKLRDTSDELKKTNEILQFSQREVLGFSEIKKEREERIDKLKSELQSMTIEFNKADSTLSKTQISLEKVSGQLQSVNIEYSNTVEKLKKINKARNDKENRLSQEKLLTMRLRREIAEHKETIKTRDHFIAELEGIIRVKEKEISTLTNDLNTLNKKTSLQINQLNEKLHNVTSLLNLEQQSREQWTEKYEKEQKNNSQMTSELLQIKSANKDLELKSKDLEIKFENQVRATEHISKTCEKMQEKANNFMNKFENSERELKTKREILKQIEAQKDEVIQKKLDAYNKLKSSHIEQIHEQEMYYEDMLSRVRILQEAYFKIEREHKECTILDSKYTIQIETLKVQNKTFENKSEQSDRQVDLLTKRIKELEEEIKTLNETINPLKATKQSLEDRNTRLQVDLKKQADELKILYKRVRMLETGKKSYEVQQEIEAEEDDESQNLSKKSGEDNEEIVRQDTIEQQLDEESEDLEGDSSPLQVTKKIIADRRAAEAKVDKEADLKNVEKKPQSAKREHTPKLKGMSLKIYKTVTRLRDTISLDESKESPNKKESIVRSNSIDNDEDDRDNTTNGLKNPIKSLKKSQKADLKTKKLKKTKEESSTSRVVSGADHESHAKGGKVKMTSKEVHAVPLVREKETNTSPELLEEYISRQAQMYLKENLKSISPIRGDQSLPSGVYEHDEEYEDDNDQIRNYQNNYQISPNSRSNYPQIADTRASVDNSYVNSSPILTKNSIHHMSNNSTILPLSKNKYGLSQIDAHKNYVNNPTPTAHIDSAYALRDEQDPQPTQRSDDLFNTSTELEPTSRQSFAPQHMNMSSLQSINQSLSPGPGQQTNAKGQHFHQISQQPGFIANNSTIMEMPNNEEIMSNPKSRESKGQDRSKKAPHLSGHGEDDGLMQSRYRLDAYDSVDRREDSKQSPSNASTSNVKQIKVKVKRDLPKKDDNKLKMKGKSSIRTLIKAARSRD